MPRNKGLLEPPIQRCGSPDTLHFPHRPPDRCFLAENPRLGNVALKGRLRGKQCRRVLRIPLGPNGPSFGPLGLVS